MAVRYWVNDDADGSWNSANNWASSSGGAGGAGVPGASDDAVFDSGDISNATADVAISVASIDMQSGYTGTLDLGSGSYAHTINGDLTVTDGTLNWGNATTTIQGSVLSPGFKLGTSTGTVVLAGTSKIFNVGIANCNGTFEVTGSYSTGSLPLFNDNLNVKNGGTLTISSAIRMQVGGILTVESGGTVTVTSNFTFRNGGSFIVNAGGTSSFNVGREIQTLDNGPFYLSGEINGDVLMSRPGQTMALLGNTTLRNITVSAGIFDLDENDLTFTEDMDLTGGAWGTKGTGIITLSGGASQNIDFNGQSVEPIEVNKTAANDLVTLTGPVNSDRITLNTGTLDLNDNTWSTSVGGQVSLLVAAGNTIQDSSVGKNGAFDLAGRVDLNGASGNLITWTDVDITALEAGVNTASWSSITNSTNSSGNVIDATDNCIDGGGNTGWNFVGIPDVDVDPVTEALVITTPQVAVQYLPFTNVDVQTENLVITTPAVNVEVFEDTVVNPDKTILSITTPQVEVVVGLDIDINPVTELLDISTPRVTDITTPVDFLIATEAQPLQYQVSVGGDVQMRSQGQVLAWRNEIGWVSVPFPAVISTQPDNLAVPQGGAIALSIVATGAATYQWYENGAALIGETSATLNITAPNQNVTLEYTCLAINADGIGIRSKAGTVTVGAGSASLVTHMGEQVTHVGENVIH